jgi:uncharacterized repeat protein (TIGR01451 family)
VKQMAIKQLLKVLVVLGLAGVAVFAFAQNTAGGTTISNTATATFTDSGGVTRTSQSNTVTTTVQTVYSFNVEPDDGLNPVTAPAFSNPTSNNTTAAAAATTTFNYTVVNNTNNGTGDTLPVTLTAVQDTGDNFDLTNVIITVYNFTDVSGDGLYTPGTDTLGTAVATGAANSPATFNFPASSQGTRYAVVVTGVLPADTAVNGGQFARLDLRATNDDAVTAGFNTTTAANANISFENQNIARVTVTERNVIGVAKNLQSVVNNGNGTFDVTYLMTVENFGNVTLSNVQVTDNLTTTFSGATFAVQSISATGTLTANSGFTGGASPNNRMLTAASSTLARQTTATITVVVRVTPGSNLGPYNNQVTASGRSPANVTVTDDSANGTDPDADGNNGNGSTDNDNNPNEGSQTPVTFSEDRGLGLAKSASAPTAVAGQPGVFETTFTFTLRNLSDTTNGTELRNVQINDNLAATFPSPATYIVQSITGSTTPALTANTVANFNTTGNVLTGTNTLARNTSGTVTMVVQFDPNGLTSFENQATATGTTPQGTVLTDLSDDGTNPDQDGDGKGNEQANAYDLDKDGTIEDLVAGAPTPDEGLVTDTGSGGANNNSNGNGTTTSENDPTPISVSSGGTLGVAKRVVSVTALTGANLGRFDVVYEINLENLGNVNLSSVQVVDNLQAELGSTATLVSIPVAPAISNVTAPSVLAANASFNGTTNMNLLTTSTTNQLRPAAVGRITFTARIDPNGVATVFNNVTATGRTPTNALVSDDSTNGTDPDVDNVASNGTTPDGGTGANDNNNDPADNTSPTPATFPETPELGVALAAGTPTNNGDGTYTVVYTVTVENLGNVDLNNVQVALPFTAGGTPFTPAQVTSATITGTTGGFTANSSGATPYNGEGNNNLLSGTNGLPVGGSGTITISMVFTPGSGLGSAAAPYLQNANGTATSPSGAAGNVTDTSQNGTDTDPDNTPNSEANDDSDPTPVFFTETPRVGLAKSASAATAVTSGTPAYPTGEFTTTFTFTFENFGNVVLSNLQATDNLNTTFGAGNYTVTGRSGTGVNTNFNGNTDQNLLAAGQTLAVGATRSVSITVRFNPNGAGTITNVATASAAGPGGTTTTDDSTNGTDPDNDGAPTGNDNNNNPGDNNNPTPVPFSETPRIGVAKAATLLNANTDNNDVTPGPYSVRFDFALRNLGNVALNTITLTENFGTTLGGSSNYTITSAPSVTTAPTNATSAIVLNNPAFNGNTNTAVLGTGSTLAVGDSAVISVTVTITAPGTYNNTVTSTASGPGGRTTTTDTSDNGTNPDGDGNGQPNEPGNNDPTPVNLDALQLAKTQRICDDANCAGDTTTPVNTNLTVAPGNYIEYTIVATNSGGAAITNASIIDLIPAPAIYAASSQASSGIQCTTDAVITGTTVWAACPASGTSATVEHTRVTAASVTAAGTVTLRFVVFVP